MKNARLFAILSFIFIGMLSRFLPHPPNFTALNALALFAAFSMGNVFVSFFTIFATMFLTDCVLGFHATLPYVYLSLAGIIGLGHLLKKNSLKKLPFFLTGSSLVFFAISNFGVWLNSSFYEKTFSGLLNCYVAAIPFLSNQILGDLIYGLSLFACFQLVENYHSKSSIKILD